MFKPEIKIEKFEMIDVITTSGETVAPCDMDGYDCPVDMGLG